MSPPHKDIFSGLPNFFNGELANSQKLRERVPCPVKQFVLTQNQSEMAAVIFFC